LHGPAGTGSAPNSKTTDEDVADAMRPGMRARQAVGNIGQIVEFETFKHVWPQLSAARRRATLVVGMVPLCIPSWGDEGFVSCVSAFCEE
jgi:hypothetical protein